MSWFSDLKIGAKLASGYAICIVLCIVVGICGLISMAEMSHKADEILNKAFGGRARIADADHSLMKMRMLEGRLLLLKGEALQKLIAEEDKTQEKTVSLIKDYVNAAEDPEDKANCVELQDTFNAYLDTHNKLLTLIDGDPKVALDYYTGERLVKARANDKVVDKISQWNQKHGISLGKASQAAFNAAKIRIASVIALAFIISGLVAYLLSRKISKALALVCERMSLLQTGALERLNEGILALESGDLTHSIKADVDRIPVTSKDEFGVLAESFNSLIDLTDRNIVSFTKSQQKLSELMTKIKASSSQVNAASHSVNEVSEQLGASVAEIGVSMNDVASASEQSATCATELAAGSTHQAQSIQESANLMGQLSTAVNQVTLESKGTAEAAHSATVVAAGGMQDVTNSINGMHAIKITIDETAEVITELGNSSERITSIVQTIDDIARQTNLLALNAAIEAARAGEAGRGFAVVADEVRKLAERSRSATHEIGALVSQIQQQTDQAVSSMKARAEDFQVQVVQVERTGEAFQQIKDAFDEVLLRAQSISDATAEMSLLSGNVSQSISEVAAVVEQSSVAAEEVSATSEEVSASVYTVANATANQVRSVEELVASSVKLRDVAESLDTAISIFKTDLDEQETTVLKLNNKPQAA